jgi:ABC-type uncharacterized transport system involved in gliding motility auxiliary subunit
MNVWAEERKQGTDELLLTLPARDVEVVLGKYLAALGIYSVALAFLAVAHVPLLRSLGNPDLGVLAATYVGYFLMGAMMIAIGLVASVLSTNVTVAFILGAVFLAVPVFAAGFGPAGQMAARVVEIPGFGWLGGILGAFSGPGSTRVLETLSVPEQFRDFGSGVIPLSGVLYFLTMAAAMLYLNMVLLGRRQWAGGRRSAGRWVHALVRVVAVVVALASLDVIVSRAFDVRVDATEERLHTLSPASKSLIASIPTDRPVYITAYVSPRVPREYVETKSDLLNSLKEVASIGGSKIKLRIVDTPRFSEQAREAETSFQIKPRTVPSLRDGRQSTEEIFLGVAFASGAEQVVVPFFDRGLPVEYELVRSIRVVSGSKRKRVGILETDAHLLGRTDFRAMSRDPEWEVVSELKKQYDVSSVSADAPIPFDEVQSVSVSGNPTGGTFLLRLEGQATASIAFNAEAKAVQKALEALPGIGEGNVKVEGGPLPKEAVSVTFQGVLGGKDMPTLEADGEALTGGKNEKPRVRVSTTTEALDALVVAQAPSLTQPQIGYLTDYLRKGGPALLLLDPVPLVDLAIAPAEPRQPPGGGMFGAQQAEPKGDLSPLLAMLNLDWPSTEIVWDTYNPHPQLDFPVEYVFIGEGSGARQPFADDPVTSGLQEVVLLFAGLLREGQQEQGPKFTPLLMTSDLGGTLTYDEAILRAPFGLSRPRPDRPHFATGQAYVLAARITGPPADAKAEGVKAPDLHVIAVSDLDMISDSIFELRRRPVESLDIFDFDNVTFILNAVDVLAGDETFIDLRKKRPQHRTLTALEAESKKFIDRSQLEQKKAEDTAKEKLEAARARLQDAVDTIRKSEEYDERTKESMVRYRQQVEERRLDLAEAQIEAQKRQQIEASRARREQAIDSIENRVRAQALALTPLPPLVLGLIVFVLRKSRENRGANPDRLA